MNEVFLKTRELGEAIMKSEEFSRVKEAEAAAMKNAEADVQNQSDMVTEYTNAEEGCARCLAKIFGL